MDSEELAFHLGEYMGSYIVFSLIGAFILQVSAKGIAKFKPSYGMAWKAVFFGGLAGVIVGLVVAFLSGILFMPNAISLPISVVFIYFTQASVYSLTIKHPDTGSIGFAKSCLLSLVIIFAVIFLGLLRIA